MIDRRLKRLQTRHEQERNAMEDQDMSTRTQTEKDRYEDRVHAMARAIAGGVAATLVAIDQDYMARCAVVYVDAVDKELCRTDPDMVHHPAPRC
jgi:hypothetical protein